MKCSEIANRCEIEQKLNEMQGIVRDWPKVGLVEISNGIVMPQQNLDEKDLTAYFSTQDKRRKVTQGSLRIFLLQSLGTSPVSSREGIKTEEEFAAVNPSVLRLLRDKAGLSDLFISAACAVGHWYSSKHVFFEYWGRSTGDISSFETFNEFLLDTYACTQFHTDFRWNTYFCLNLPPLILTRFIQDVRADSELVNRLFYFDVVIADEVIKKWQCNMRTERGTLKALEKASQLTDLDSITRQLHTLSRNWHIHFRNLCDFEAWVHFLQSASRRYARLLHQHESTAEQAVRSMKRTSTLDESLRYLLSSCKSLKHLITDYQGRTIIQINLLFHLTNQAESRASKSIAALTADLTRKTQQDSASMITIAAVTMFFLPGTFIASFMNSVFFSFDEDEIKVSRIVWVFPMATVPLTLVVFGVWLGWIQWRRRKDSKRREKIGAHILC